MLLQQEKLVEYFENNGYPFASCTTTALINEMYDKLLIELSLIIEIGHYVILERVDADVDGKTKPSVISHLMLFKANSIYRQRNIDRGIRRLNRAGIVSITRQPYPALDTRGKWSIVIGAKDMPATSVSGVLGYADEKLSGDIEFSSRNIAGTGRAASFSVYVSESDREIEIYYREPFIGNVNIAPDIYSSWEKYDSTYSTREHKLGVNFPLSFELDSYIGLVVRRTVPGIAGSAVLHSEEFGLEGGLTYTTLNHPTLPTRGVKISTSITGEYLHRWGSNDTEEIGSNGGASAIMAIPTMMWLSLWFRAAGWGWLKPTIPPESDWEYIGGWQNLRGYRENQFSGCRLVWGTLEPRIIPVQSIHIFPFMDFGSYRDSEKWNTKIGYGAGVEFLYGGGVFSIEYGIGESRTLSGGLLHFGIRMEM